MHEPVRGTLIEVLGAFLVVADKRIGSSKGRGEREHEIVHVPQLHGHALSTVQRGYER